MKIIAVILILVASSLAYTNAEESKTQHTDVRSSDLHPHSKSKKHQLHIDRETGLDGKVRSIRLDPNDDYPGIRAYGNPKNKVIDSKKFEQSEPKPILRGDPRNSRVLEITSLDAKKNNTKENGHIERVPIMFAKQQDLRGRTKRSLENSLKNNTNDLVAAEAKVFRPLFVYRQQVEKRRQRKEKEKIYKKKYYPSTTVRSRIYYRHPNIIYYY